jgi:DNA polymerase-3 subunit epsilon
MRLFRRAAPAGRWLVLDTESSGLDPARDRLLAVAAVAVRPDGAHLLVQPGDSFEAVLRPDAAPAVDKANILVHGIGVQAQQQGAPAAAALAALESFVAGAPLLGFHVGFDRALLDRAMRAALGRQLAGPWIDLADLAPVLRPDLRATALDDWLAAFGITVAARHQAAADALATAELLQRLWPLARAQGVHDAAALAKLAAARRWITAR